MHVTNVYRYWKRCDFFCCLVAGLSKWTGGIFVHRPRMLHEQKQQQSCTVEKKKIHDISDNDDDAGRSVCIICHYITCQFYFDILSLIYFYRSFARFFFFSCYCCSSSSMKTSTFSHNIQYSSYSVNLCLYVHTVAQSRKRMWSLQTIESAICQNEVHKSPQEYICIFFFMSTRRDELLFI